MKEFLVFGLVFAAYVLTVSLGQESNVRSNRHAGASIQMSYSVDNNNNDDSSSNTTTPRNHTGGHISVGVWRARGRGHRRLPNHDGYNSVANGTHRRRYTARGSRGRRYRAHGRRLPVSPTGIPRGQHRQNSTRTIQGRTEHSHQQQRANRRLVATGSHSISPGSRRPDGGIDPFTALQNGHRQSPFQDRQTAYDFLSNGGNSYRVRSRRQRERQDENARMASVMCAVFNKQFVPSAIGGRCVDPA